MKGRKNKKRSGRPPGGLDGMRVRDYDQVSVRLHPKDKPLLDSICSELGLNRAQVLEAALALPLSYYRTYWKRKKKLLRSEDGKKAKTSETTKEKG